MFTRAIVRKPCKNMVKGITSSKLGLPDYKNALNQHSEYVKALEKCGLSVTILEGEEEYPDSVFVEDTALLTPKCAIITNPGANARKGEIATIENAVKTFYTHIERIQNSGTLDAGDVMMVGSHFYIGLSDRTNLEGANQLIGILNKYGMTGSPVSLKTVLHLKTGVNYLENNTLLAFGEFLSKPELQNYKIIEVPKDESYASNSLWVNGIIIVPKGFPRTLDLIQKAGYKTMEVDVSEFRKLDGGLSCLSLRF